MPVKIDAKLPAKAFLEQENIFVMTADRALEQEIRPLRIAILNLMPNKIATETQLLRLIGNTPLQVEIALLRTASYDSRHTQREHLDSFYKTFDEVVAEKRKFDGLIITGAPVERMDFSEVAYWDELRDIMEWAKHNVYSTMYICWAAQAAMFYLYGIDKRPLDKKLSGIFRHRVLNRFNPLVRGFNEVFRAPHSRHTEVEAGRIAAEKQVEILAQSDEAGVYLVCSRDLRHVFVFGHGEYDVDTLHNEYMRDLAAGMAIDPPQHYYIDDVVGQLPPISWRAHESLLMQNWLNYCVYQSTPYDIETIQ
ncbi:MAG: homoserine O-succinyltransferase [Clostridia bacterium]|nr:homoserine O-succinyltransferase [Clostridia bacterium]